MRFTPDFPARRARQKAFLPMPLGLTTPSPVMTTRGTMRSPKQLCHSSSLPNPSSDARTTVHVTRSGIISHDVAWPLPLGSVLPHQVQLLQLRLRRLFA